jgi:hypothetical protein
VLFFADDLRVDDLRVERRVVRFAEDLRVEDLDLDADDDFTLEYAVIAARAAA